MLIQIFVTKNKVRKFLIEFGNIFFKFQQQFIIRLCQNLWYFEVKDSYYKNF